MVVVIKLPGFSWRLCVCMPSNVWLFAASWTPTCQAPLSMKFSRKEYWSRLPLPILGHLPDPGIKPVSLAPPAVAGRFFTTSATWEDQCSLEGYACMHAKSPQPCLTLCDIMPTHLPPPQSPFPGKNNGVGCHFLLKGIFPTQGSNPHLLRLLC